MTKLLIAGATGLVGKLVLEQALADARVDQVFALTRRPLPPHGKLESLLVDYAALPDDAAWWAVDGVVCALGTTRAKTPSPAAYRAIDHDAPLAVARHARAHGATRFALVSSLGADPGSRFVYPRTKGELERELQTVGYPSLTIVRPSMLDGDRAEQRTLERAALVAFGLLAPVLPRRLRVSPADTVAASILEGAIAAPPGVHVRTNEDML